MNTEVQQKAKKRMQRGHLPEVMKARQAMERRHNPALRGRRDRQSQGAPEGGPAQMQGGKKDMQGGRQHVGKGNPRGTKALADLVKARARRKHK